MRRRTFVGLVVALGLVAASCGGESTSLAFGNVTEEVGGNVVTLPFAVEGVAIVAADGDTSGTSGHFHIFMDRQAPDVGGVVPMEAGIWHTTDNPARLYGIPVGEHTFTVVLGDGTHTRFGEHLLDEVTVNVLGPSVRGAAPATITEGEDLVIQLEAEGVQIVAADGDDSGESGHFHVIVDPANTPQPGDVFPTDAEGITHTTGPTAAVSGLEPGEHTIWVVLGDGNHRAFDPPVMDRLTVSVQAAEE